MSMPDFRYVHKCYNMLKMLDSKGKVNWVTRIRQNLYANGFGYVWENQGVANEKLFLNEYIQRLKDQYMQRWTTLCKESPKLSTYITFKTNFETKPYFSVLNIKKFRFAFVSLRCSSHQLMIEKGRYTGIDRDQRFCPFCKIEIEDEYHFVLVCPLYKDLREKYIPYLDIASRYQFSILMSSRNESTIKNLAAYIYHSYNLRNNFTATV